MKTLLIIADDYYSEAKLFFAKDFTILQASYLIPDNSGFDECYRLFAPYSEAIVIDDCEASDIPARVKRLAVRGGFNGTILATICQSIADVSTILLPENAANFTTVLKPYTSWPPLKKESELQPKEPFPIHCLPESAREFCHAVSDSTGTPIDFAGVAAIGCMAGAIGASTRLEVKSGWSEHAALWFATVAPPGSAKTPVQSLVLKPLQEIQAVLCSRFTQAMKNFDPELDEKPSLEVLLYGDTTQEALFKNLAASQRGGVLVADEITGWIQSHNKYQKGGNDRQAYLSLWSSTPVSLLRKIDGVTFIPLPVVSILGGLTPSSLPSLHGGNEDGFLSRFLVSNPDKVKQKYNRNGVSLEMQAAWLTFIQKLWNIEPETNGGGLWLPATVKLSSEAEELFEQFFNNVHEVLNSETIPSLFRGSWAKAPSQAARLALVIHLGRQACGDESYSNEVSVDTMDAAVQVMRYFLGHLSALETGFNIGASRAEGIRLKILGWLKRYGVKHPGRPAKWSSIRHDLRAALSNGELVNDRLLEQSLESLQEQGFIRLQPVESIAGRNSKPEIIIRPGL